MCQVWVCQLWVCQLWVSRVWVCRLWVGKLEVLFIIQTFATPVATNNSGHKHARVGRVGCVLACQCDGRCAKPHDIYISALSATVHSTPPWHELDHHDETSTKQSSGHVGFDISVYKFTIMLTRRAHVQ